MYELAKPGPKTRKHRCAMCQGTGMVPAQPRDRRGPQRTCHQCGGRGEI